MDEDLVQRAQAGDAAAFRALVERYTPLAWRTVRVLVYDRDRAEDALQEAWIDVWRGLPRVDATRPLRPWLLSVVANRCRMQGRQRIVPALPLNAHLADELPDDSDAISAIAACGPDDALAAALDRLDADQRQVLVLRYAADLTLDEIAQVCKLSLSTVKSRLYRALARLREQLTAHSAALATKEAHR